MVSYGPWRQDPDFEHWYNLNAGSGNGSDGQPLFDYGLTGVQRQSGYQDPVRPITVDDLAAAVADASPPGPGGEGNSRTVNEWGTAYSWAYYLSHPAWNSEWEAESAHRAFRILPRAYSYNPLYEPDPDPEAVGVEYQTQPYSADDPWAWAPASAVSRGISTTYSRFGGVWFDNNSGTAPSSPTDVKVLAATSSAEPQTIHIEPPAGVGLDGTQYRDLTTFLDLTPFLSGSNWAGTVWTEQGFAGPSINPSPYTSGTVRYGWGFDRIRVVTMVRPPVYRWVYATTPIRQTSHRDDHLAGGAYQTWPVPTSRQLSNTTFGGYL